MGPLQTAKFGVWELVVMGRLQKSLYVQSFS